jgi:pimeloyl-ACP methyl ester carboxylesterase
MRASVRWWVGAAVVLLLAMPAAARAQVVPGPCTTGLLASGAASLFCVPVLGWNGQLVVFAHGYVDPDDPLGFQLPELDGVPVPLVVQSMGFAFATTTYRTNGLAILEGVDDIRLLLAAFRASNPAPTRTHLVGVSEGGLVATLLAERFPSLVSSTLAACAPIGNFRLQINYLGDFRVLFDYFFPGVIPGSAIAIPPGVVQNWETVYAPAVTAALVANPARALELMRVAKAAYDPSNLATVVTSALNILRYNVKGTNDATVKLGGNPFGNRLTWYFGSSNDLRLNLTVRRFAASPAAIGAMHAYETNGDLRVPLVTLHTTADEAVPFGHELLYLTKVDLFDRGRFLPIPVARYGHCNFTAQELLASFGLAVSLP